MQTLKDMTCSFNEMERAQGYGEDGTLLKLVCDRKDVISGEEVLVAVHEHLHEGLALQELDVRCSSDPAVHVSDTQKQRR